MLSIEYGLSRERIRQIAQKLGTPEGHILRSTEARAKSAAREKGVIVNRANKCKARFDKYEIWRKLWDDGLSLREMAEVLGVQDSSIGVRMSLLRKEFPTWFPRRRHNHHVLLETMQQDMAHG